MSPVKDYKTLVLKGGSRKGETAFVFGEEMTIQQISIVLNINRSLLCPKARKGKTLEESLEYYINYKNLTLWRKRYPREYSIWCGIKSRVLNKNEQRYEYYSPLGMEKSWQGHFGFVNFIRDVGAMPDYKKINGRSKWSIDRIDNTKGYFSGNCRWATMAQQMRNRSDNHWIGDSIAKDACAKSGIKNSTFHQRLRYGWSEERALNTPVHKKGDC